MSTIDRLILDAESNDAFIKQLMSSIVLATKESNSLPQGSDYEYYAMAPEFKKATKKIGNETLGLISKVCGLVNPDVKLRLPDDIGDPILYEQIVDVIDALLEGADRSMEGMKSKESRISNAVSQTLMLDKQRVLQQNVKVMRKPQEDFAGDYCNFRHVAFQPKLKEKYHAETPLDMKPRNVELDAEESLSGCIRPDNYYAHPYETELRRMPLPPWCLNGDDVAQVNSMPTYSQFPFVLVDKEASFEQMLRDLAGKKELAIDLEHHSYHTFQGLTCLIQISSREHDFLVDALALRFQLHRLGQFFADRSVVKVLHGCDKDVLWLQRDCGLYLVNCFDTHVAAKALGYPALSLAHLLKVHCGVTADKKHQLSDWRERPLPQEMQHYANEDTRYLLYMYDRMRHELWKKLGKAGLEQVFNASRQLCLARYEMEPFDPQGFKKLFQEKSSSRSIPKLDALSSLQLAALSALWNWRDLAARDEDESPAALMSNAELLRIGVNLPQTDLQLEQVCGPLSAYTRASASKLLSLVADATSVGPSAAVLKPSAGAQKVVPESVATPRGKRSKLASVSADGELSVNPDSVCTFTPAVFSSPGPSTGQRNSATEVTNSPVPQTDEIFRQAGWSTPIHKASHGGIGQSSSLFEGMQPQELSEDRALRIAKSRETVAKMCSEKIQATQQQQAQAQRGAAPSAKAAPKASTKAEVAAAAEPVAQDRSLTTRVDIGGYAMDIPKSFEEVYQLSQRNRQRNKDKRRGASGGADEDEGEGSDAMEVADTGDSSDKDDLLAAAAGASSKGKGYWDAKALKSAKIDPSFYLKASADSYKETSIDNTLEMARSLGWVGSGEEGAALKEAHLQDLSYQQAEGAMGAGDDSTGSVKSDQSGGVRRSFEKAAKQAAGASGTAKSGGSKDNKGHQQHGQQPGIASGQSAGSSASEAKRSKLPKEFKYPTANVMGALPSNGPVVASKDDAGYSAGAGKAGKQKQQHQGGGQQRSKSGDSGAANPYFFGTK